MHNLYNQLGRISEVLNPYEISFLPYISIEVPLSLKLNWISSIDSFLELKTPNSNSWFGGNRLMERMRLRVNEIYNLKTTFISELIPYWINVKYLSYLYNY